MHPAAMHFASGNSLFSGFALIVAAYGAMLMRPGRISMAARRLSPLLLFGGLLGIALSSTPIPLPIVLLASLAMLPLLRDIFRRRPREENVGRLRIWGGLLALAVTASPVLVAEALSLRGPDPGKLAAQLPVYVIGDSISAADTDAAIAAWPELLAKSGVQVTNLARVAATAGSALSQVQKIPSGPAVVHILIGGNDIFGTNGPARFESDLDSLLSAATGPGRILVLWELPLPPLHQAFSAAQRRQAEKHQAMLVSKRALSRVFATAGATVDGIHLSQLGQQLMADLLVVTAQHAE